VVINDEYVVVLMIVIVVDVVFFIQYIINQCREYRDGGCNDSGRWQGKGRVRRRNSQVST
jgi:hypothetical protein